MIDERIIKNILAFLENTNLSGNQAEAMVEAKQALQKELIKPVVLGEENGDSN